MRKRFLAIALAGMMLLVITAGCADSTQNSDPSSPKNSSKSESGADANTKASGKIVLWDNFTEGTLNEAHTKVVEAYQAQNSAVEVERVPKELQAMGETLKAAFMAGNAPDVLYYEGGIGTVGTYLKAGYLLDLSDAYTKYGWKDSLMSAAWEVPSVGDYIYGVGNEIETMGLYFNQDIFDKEKLEAPKTVEELTEVMQKLKDAGYTPLGNLMGSLWYENMNPLGTILYAFMSQEEIADCMDNDGSWDKTSVRRAISQLQEWLDKGFFPDSPQVDGDSEQMFFNQDCVMLITGNWAVGNINTKATFKTTAIPFPGSTTNADKGSQVNFVGGAYLVSSESKNQNTAIDFINFAVNTPEASTIWSDIGGTVPPYTGKYETSLSDLGKEVSANLLDESLQNTAGINMWLGVNSFDFFSTAGQKIIIGDLNPDSFVAQADAATKKDVESHMTKGSFVFD